MDITSTLLDWPLLAAAGGALAAPAAWQRLQLSRAKHPSLAGHARWGQRLTGWISGWQLDEADFFSHDGAPPDVVARRRAGWRRLSAELQSPHPRTLAATGELRRRLSDLQFTTRYRVPFPYADLVQRHLPIGAVLQAAGGAEVVDLDGRRFIDLTGSYGVNLLGHDAYRDNMADGLAAAQDLGMVLGAYHPCVQDNVRRLAELSGMDEVSFHMSGTEAVMQAVRLARYHSARRKVVRFCGAYHGWWDTVQPGPGNPLPARDTYTLREMDPRSLAVLAGRRDIACVLVNPLQALHPNRNAPADGQLIGVRRIEPADPDQYRAWLLALRDVCSRRGIALIIDEVFMGFRLAPGGAQQRYGVQADLVTYGKTLGGGLPVGVVCGRARWMKRFDVDRPTDICLARGTFNAHPLVMTAMNAFLRRLDSAPVRAAYAHQDAHWARHAQSLNADFERAGLPLFVRHLGSVWALGYSQPSHWHWLLQFYLRAQGLALSWVGSGRLVFSFAHDDAVMDQVRERVLHAAQRMHDDGWWWHDGRTNAAAMQRRLLREMLARRLGLGRR